MHVPLVNIKKCCSILYNLHSNPNCKAASKQIILNLQSKLSPFLHVPLLLHLPGQVTDKTLSNTEYLVLFWNVLFLASSSKQSALSLSLEAVVDNVEFVIWG